MLIEDKLWKALKTGDTAAFTEMYKAYYQFLFVNGFRICANKETTKDCIHEMFLEIWNNRQQLPAVQHVGFYLKTYLRRKILKEIPKTQSLSFEVTEETDTAKVQFSYEELLIQSQSREEVKEKVRRAILHLSKRELEVVRMKFFEDKSYEEIAAITSTTPRTIYNQVYEALKTMRKYLRLFF